MGIDWNKIAPENRKRAFNAMKKYGHNRWWESKDPIYVAKHQIFEGVLLVDFKLFHEGIKKLLGRPVYTHELGLNVKGLRKEANEAVARLEKGEKLVRSPLEKARKIREAIQQLEKIDKTIVTFHVDKKKGVQEEVNNFLKSIKRKKNLR